MRARNFPAAWGFLQASQAASLGLGVPLAGQLNSRLGGGAGYYAAGAAVLAGAATLGLVDLHKQRIRRGRRQRSSRRHQYSSRTSQAQAQPSLWGGQASPNCDCFSVGSGG